MSEHHRAWSFHDAPVERSFAWGLALTTLPVVSAFVVSWVIARWAGPSVWGTVSWAMAFATALLIVAKMGVELGASRLASEYGVGQPALLRRLYRVATQMRAAFTLPVAALSFILAHPIARAFHDEALVWPVRLAAVIVVCASLFEFQEQFLVGLNRHATVARIRALMLGARAVATVALVAAGLGAVTLLTGYVAAWVLGIAAFVVLLRRYLPAATEAGAEPGLRRRLFAISIPLAVSSASVTIYTQMDKLMLGYFDNVEEVGQYALARAVTEVSLFPAFALVVTLRPALAARFSSGRVAECARLIRRSLRLSFASGVMFASVFAVLSLPLFTTVYSDAYRYAAGLMGLFVWVIVLRSVGALLLPALIAAERTRRYAVLTTASAVANFVLNLALIPSLHARGAVIATLVSYALLLGFGLREVFVVFGVRPSLGAAWVAVRTLFAGGAAATLTWIVLNRLPASTPPWTALALAAAQALVFVALAAALGVLPRELVGKVLKTNR
ncbi:MAG: flippase [Candidatus Krumholzibacteria bacterium]|nr:flippase [Candidatus Krumholzibacteria bacterium]